MIKIKSPTVLFYFLINLITIFSLNAQQTLNASGGDALGSGGTASYSVGSLFYTEVKGSSGSLTQGVQHGYEILTVGKLDASLKVNFNVFPNPTTDRVVLVVDDFSSEQIFYQLCDVHGKLLNAAPVQFKETEISMISYPAAVYSIQILNNRKQKLQSFQIVKT